MFEEQKSQLPIYFCESKDTIENNNASQNQKMHYNNAVSKEKSRNSVTPTDVQDVEF